MGGSDVLLILILFVVGISKKLQTEHDLVKLELDVEVVNVIK